MIDQQALAKLAEDTFDREMITTIDPKDMSYILPELDGLRMGIEAFLAHSILFRMYNKQATYEALKKHAGALQPGKRDPDWAGMEKELTTLYAGSEAVWGGMFYPATLRAAKLGNGKWKRFKRGGVTTPQDKAFRDVHVFKAVWNALCKDGTAAEFLKMRQR